jgi:hypothetical protein
MIAFPLDFSSEAIHFMSKMLMRVFPEPVFNAAMILSGDDVRCRNQVEKLYNLYLFELAEILLLDSDRV